MHVLSPPAEFTRSLHEEECQHYPDPGQHDAQGGRRRLLTCTGGQRELALADRIVAPSRFIQQALVNEGVEPEQIEVIPCPVRLDGFFLKHAESVRRRETAVPGGLRGQPDSAEGPGLPAGCVARARPAGRRVVADRLGGGRRALAGNVAPRRTPRAARLTGSAARLAGPVARVGVPDPRRRLWHGRAGSHGRRPARDRHAQLLAPPELVRDGQSGFIVGCRSVMGLADRLWQLHQDREQAIAMGQAARATAEALDPARPYGALGRHDVQSGRPGRRATGRAAGRRPEGDWPHDVRGAPIRRDHPDRQPSGVVGAYAPDRGRTRRGAPHVWSWPTGRTARTRAGWPSACGL